MTVNIFFYATIVAEPRRHKFSSQAVRAVIRAIVTAFDDTTIHMLQQVALE